MTSSLYPTRYCGTCKSPLHGRRDKKFCNSNCRNDYYNYLRSKNDLVVKRINASLEKNRRILRDLLKEGGDTITANRETMVRLGYQFKYSTHSYTTRKNEKTYHYCYDHGYLALDNQRYLVVAEK